MHLTPAQVAISVFGTPMALARAIGASPAAPFRWKADRGPNGRGQAGDIPVPQIRRIIEAAQARGLAVTERDLIYGRDVPDDAATPVGEPATVGA